MPMFPCASLSVQEFNPLKTIINKGQTKICSRGKGKYSKKVLKGHIENTAQGGLIWVLNTFWISKKQRWLNWCLPACGPKYLSSNPHGENWYEQIFLCVGRIVAYIMNYICHGYVVAGYVCLEFESG